MLTKTVFTTSGEDGGHKDEHGHHHDNMMIVTVGMMTTTVMKLSSWLVSVMSTKIVPALTASWMRSGVLGAFDGRLGHRV